jgi:two-component system NarL family sensor kinase
MNRLADEPTVPRAFVPGSAPHAVPRVRNTRRVRRPRIATTAASTRQALVRFGLVSLLVAIAVGAVGAVAGRGAARNQSIQDATRVTQVLARSVVEPNTEPSLLTGDPAAIAHLDEVIRGRVTSGSLVRVKIWTPQGRIVYSDEHRLIGTTYGLGAEELLAITRNRADAEVSDLTAPENRFERGQGPMLEVYLPIWTANHDVLLFETYSRYHEVVTAPAGSIWRDFLPITLGAVLLLQLLQLPLVWRTASRLDRSVGERDRLTREAQEASATERRRIAADLHDSVVQDLAAVSYSLAGVAERSHAPPAELRPIRAAASTVRRSISALRTLLVELYPDNLESEGLSSALTDLTAPLIGAGVEVRLAVTPGLRPTRATSELVFRVAAEALRNVAAHADAHRVTVTLRTVTDQEMAGGLELLVEDDGHGFDPLLPVEAGHLGLSLLRDRAERAGGGLTVDSIPGAGACLRLLLPLREESA